MKGVPLVLVPSFCVSYIDDGGKDVQGASLPLGGDCTDCA